MSASGECCKDECASGLYRELLQSRWSELPDSIRRLHSTFAPQQIRGRFAVQNGTGTVAGLLTRLLHLPSAADLLEGTLTVRRDGKSEIWLRRFGTQLLETEQFAGPEAVLLERFGAIELSFD